MMDEKSGEKNGAEATETDEKTEHSSESGEESEASSEEDVYNVDKIVSHKRQRGKYVYRIRWQGYSEDQDTWEPEENLLGEFCIGLLGAYKKAHNIAAEAGSGGSKKQRYSYVSEDEGESEKKWFVSEKEEQRELRNLYVQDRILDDTEKFLAGIQDDPIRLTRTQRKMLEPQSSKIPEKHLTDDDSGRARSRKKRSNTSSTSAAPASKSPRISDPLKRKAASSKTKKSGQTAIAPKNKPETSEPRSTEKTVAHKDENGSAQAKPESSKQALKAGPSTSGLSAAHAVPKKSTLSPMSRVGTDPKKAVTSKIPTSDFSAYRIPKKTSTAAPTQSPTKSAVKAVLPEVKRVDSLKKPVTPQKSLEKKDEASMGSTLSVEPAASKTTQWRSAKTDIQEKDCTLPGTQLSLKATLNVQPSQLLSLNSLIIDMPPFQYNNITQMAFNEAVLGNKIATVRGALRNKAHGLDLDFAEKGRTLLHKLSEMNCDQQHTQDEIIDCLVNAGADMSLTENEFYRTALHQAVYSKRSCHVRKLIQLGSPINTSDVRDETPLITALKMNQTELARLLLCSGATYQAVFSKKTNLSTTQQKPVVSYQNVLQSAMAKSRQAIFSETQKFVPMSPVFQAPLYETHQMDFMVYNKPECDASLLFPILMIALVEHSDKTVTAVSWGEGSPVEAVHLNGALIELLQDTNPFYYMVSPFNQQNSINIIVDYSRAQHSKQILAAQVFGIERNEILNY